MSDIKWWKECATVVQAILDGKRTEDMDNDVLTYALAAGLIENPEQTKPCKTCGKPMHDFRFWRVTASGRMLAAAVSADPTKGTT